MPAWRGPAPPFYASAEHTACVECEAGYRCAAGSDRTVVCEKGGFSAGFAAARTKAMGPYEQAFSSGRFYFTDEAHAQLEERGRLNITSEMQRLREQM